MSEFTSAYAIDALQTTINTNSSKRIPTNIVQNYDGYIQTNNLLPSDISTGSDGGDLTDFVSIGSAKYSTVTTFPYQGANCVFVCATDVWSGLKIDSVVSQNTQYTYSVYLKGIHGDEQLDIALYDNNGWLNDKEITLTNSWARYNITTNTSSGGTNLQVKIISLTRHPITFYYDAAKLETGSTPTVWNSTIQMSTIIIPSNTRLEGHCYNLKNISLVINNRTNVFINNTLFQNTTASHNSEFERPIIKISGICNNITISNCVINKINTGSPGVYINPINISNLSIINNIVNDTDDHGYAIICDGPNEKINNVIFSNDTANYCGFSNRENDWVVGFNLADMNPANEVNTLHITNLSVSECTAKYNWESGFHIEPSIFTRKLIIQNCTSNFNGQKPNPSFGAGYTVDSAATLNNNIADNNYNGFFIYNGIAASSRDNDTSINVNNCSDSHSRNNGIYIYGFDDRLLNSTINFNNDISYNCSGLGFNVYRIYNMTMNNVTIVNPKGNGKEAVLLYWLYNSSININYSNPNAVTPFGVLLGLSTNVSLSGNYDHGNNTALKVTWPNENSEITLNNLSVTAKQHGILLNNVVAGAKVNLNNITITNKYGNYAGYKICRDGISTGEINYYCPK